MNVARWTGRLGLGFLAGGLLATQAYAAPVHCVVNAPTTCPNTNNLSWAPGFSDAVARVTHGLKASYFGPNQTLTEEALSGLGGPPQNRVELPGRRYLFSACPPHDCAGDAAAVILNEQGDIQALGFSSFHCHQHCDSHRFLDFYIRQGSDEDALAGALWDWGTGETVRPPFPEANIGMKEHVHIHPLP